MLLAADATSLALPLIPSINPEIIFLPQSSAASLRPPNHFSNDSHRPLNAPDNRSHAPATTPLMPSHMVSTIPIEASFIPSKSPVNSDANHLELLIMTSTVVLHI